MDRCVYFLIDPRTPATAGEKGTAGSGWAKGIELVKLAMTDRQNFDCATW
jgi:hypothetical protein